MKIHFTLTFLLAAALIQLTWAETCQEEYDRLSEELKKGPILGLELPSCEGDGSYKPVQCMGSQCLCVTEDGSTIGNYSVVRGQDKDMDCLCARFVSKSNIASDSLPTCLENGNFEKLVPATETCGEARELLSLKMASDSPPTGTELPNCEEDGTYTPVQCRGSQCFCVSVDGVMLGYSVNRWEAKEMDCLCARFVFDSTIASERLPTCLENGNFQKLVPATETCSEARELLSLKMASDSPLVGLELPNCEEDGTYTPVQCRGSECFCVSAEGSMIGYSVNRWEAKGMDCLCARHVLKSKSASDRLPTCLNNGNHQKLVPEAETCSDAVELLTTDLVSDSPPVGRELPNCEEDGTYKPVQCRGSECFCVSAEGSMIGYSVNRWEANGMNCLCALVMATSGLQDSNPSACEDNGNFSSDV